MNDETKATLFSKILLREARQFPKAEEYNRHRLPDWLNTARVVVGRKHRTTMFLFLDSTANKDEFVYKPDAHSLLDLIEGVPDRYTSKEYTSYHHPKITPTDDDGMHLLGSKGEDGQSTIIELDTDNASFVDFSGGHHPPTSVSNMFFRFVPDDIPVSTGYIPYAILLHDFDFENINNILRIFRLHISAYLEQVYRSKIGDFYERRSGKTRTIVSNKEDTVIVLGDYDGGQHESELKRFREELEANGYHAHLIKELPNHSSQSLAQKVKMWCLTSRFVTLIDRKPSGHIREYTELSKEDIPLALLREENSGSTYMIGPEHHTDDYIELFEFGRKPNEVTTEVIEWAEELVADLSEIYDSEYPWRGE